MIIRNSYILKSTIDNDGSQNIMHCNVYHFKNGNIKSFYHNDFGPALYRISKDGHKKYEMWYVNGDRHRNDGPSVINYYENGYTNNKQWYKFGKLHSTYNPAIITFNKINELVEIQFYIDGRNILDVNEWLLYSDLDEHEKIEMKLIMDNRHNLLNFWQERLKEI